MNELHLFAGAGGGILGGLLLGHRPVCAVEIEPYCREVLLQRQRDGILPWFPIWDNIRTFNGKPWRGIADIVCGGFPCQDISAAGTRDGINGVKSSLWKEMARIICEIMPSYIFVENSPALTFRGLDCVLRDMARMGYNAKWGVLGASETGLPHRRNRIWILASHNSVKRRGSSFTQQDIKNKGDMGKGNKTINSFDRLCLQFERETETTTSENGRPSYLCRMDDGMGNNVDRLKAIGNGQVPAVAASAWRILISL